MCELYNFIPQLYNVFLLKYSQFYA